MTNINKTPDKAPRRSRLFQIGLDSLRREGWTVERIPGIGKSSVRRMSKNGETRKVSIRTSQDTWFAFPRNHKNNGWVTLSDVDSVVVVSVDDRSSPKFAKVHVIDADEVRQRFDRAYAARIAAGHTIPLGRGVWVSLYDQEGADPVNRVGAGAGLKHPPIARVALEPDEPHSVSETSEPGDRHKPLTIAEAKRRLATTLGVDPSSIKITVEA
jgi:hypothetical protein